MTRHARITDSSDVHVLVHLRQHVHWCGRRKLQLCVSIDWRDVHHTRGNAGL
jgi:hypothetical protein